MAHDAGKHQPPSLDEFSKRLDAARGGVADAKNATTGRDGNGMGRAFRLSSELLAALMVGSLLGWGCDKLFSVTPWGLLAGILIGFAAGVLNVARAIKHTNDASSGADD